MYTLAKISIFVNILGLIKSTYLETGSNYRSTLARNNILNKGLWVKKNSESKNSGDFIFKTNSFDIDNIRDNNVFNDEDGTTFPFFSTYVERNKRDTQKSINSNPHLYTPFTEDFEKIMKPLKESTQNSKKQIQNNAIYFINDVNSRGDYESRLIKTNDFNEKLNGTKNTFYKNISDQLVSQQTAPVQIIKTNKIPEKSQENTSISNSKRISEKGLLKVLGMLTKTFKRIMKQHNDIKLIHNKLHSLNSDFMNNLETLTKKFEDFDNKYNQIIKINEKLNEKENSLKNSQKNLINKEKELSNSLIEFEKQQKKFVMQQSQFYNVQKQMLAQNEKINMKQAQIAKSQGEISHKQNYFARILQKVQQLSVTTHQPKANIPKKINMMKMTDKEHQSISSTTLAPQTESVKINLFSIPPLKELQNHEKEILKEKDQKPIDDLIYKYYFNNTFIDEIIKNKLLANVINVSDATHNLNKRKPRKSPKTTILLPVNSFNEPKHRERRWIRRQKKKTSKNENITLISKNTKHIILKEKNRQKPNTDPFMKMAMTFCTELDQNQNVQEYNWCVEKALRRLQVIDLKMTATPKGLRVFEVKNNSELSATSSISSTDVPETFTQTSSTTPLQEVATEPDSTKYFPDNDELESNLKQYELKPDTDGNVYFEGSLHVSDIDHIDAKDQDSDGFSDLMPGFDSNSRIEVDPAAIELQAKRRAAVRRINERINRIKMA